MVDISFLYRKLFKNQEKMEVNVKKYRFFFAIILKIVNFGASFDM